MSVDSSRISDLLKGPPICWWIWSRISPSRTLTCWSIMIHQKSGIWPSMTWFFFSGFLTKSGGKKVTAWVGRRERAFGVPRIPNKYSLFHGEPATELRIEFPKHLPSANLTLLLKMVIYSGFKHWKCWFLILMLVYQRVLTGPQVMTGIHHWKPQKIKTKLSWKPVSIDLQCGDGWNGTHKMVMTCGWWRRGALPHDTLT